MSIGPIETNPVGDDDVEIVDPGDVTVEPSYGHDTRPWELRPGQATGHADPGAENITHVPGVARSRELDGMEFFDLDLRTPEHGKGTDPDAAFTSGTETRPDRYVHDEALQVRQLLATQIVTQGVFVATNTPTLLAVQRTERVRLHIRLSVNSGAVGTNLFISPRRGAVAAVVSAVASSGGVFGMSVPVGTDTELVLQSSEELWATADDDMTVFILDEFRTDVDSQ